MGSEFFWGDKKYVSSKRAAEISGYAPDYIGQLCRKRKLECRLIGRGWFVTEASLLEHKNATKTRPAFQTEKTQKILIKKIEPATPEKSPLISQVPDSWDAFLFREEYQIQKKELQDAYESNYSTENFGAIYPDTFSQKNKEERGVYFKNINERNKILSPFLNFSYSLFVKTLVPMTLVIATGIGVFYVKDIASPLLANLLDSQKIVFKNNIRSFSLNESGNFSSHFENTVQKMQSYFDKKIIYINQAAGGINDNYPLTQNEIPSEDKYKQNIKNVGMLIAAVNFTELFSTELLMNTTQNVKRGYICILEYVSGNTHCFIKTEKVIANKGFSTSILSNFSLQLYHLTNNLMQPIRQEFFTSLVTKLGSRVYQTTNNVTKAVKENTFKLFTAQSPMQTETPNLKEAALRLKQKKEGEISANIISDIATSTTKEQSVVFNPVNENTLIAREGVKNLEQKGFAVESTTGAQTIVERVIERVVAGISPEDIAAQLNALENKLRQEIFKVGESGTREVRVVERQVALTNKIDQLPDVTLINATVSGNFTGLTDAHIPNDIVATNYLELAGGNITGTLGVGTTTPTEDFAVANRIYVGGTGTSTIENNLQVGGALSVSGVCLNCAGNNVLGNAALSVSGTSTFSGQLLSTNVSTVPHSFGTWAIGAAGSNPLTASFVVDPASADSDTNLFAISIGGSARFLVDAEGDVFANSITAVGGVTLSTTSASTFTVEGDTTLGDASTTDRTYFNSRIGSSLIPTADNILDIGDTTNSLAWRTGIFGTSLGVGTTSPAWTLSVAGTGSFDDYVRASYFIATSTVATSTFSGFLDVTGTNSTSTFSGGLTADAFAVTGTASSTFTGGLIVTSGNLSLATNGTFFISDTLALSANTLGSSVVNSSLTSVGTLSSLSVSGAATFSDTLSVSGLASFINASTSRLSVFDTAYFGGTATSTFDSTGALVLNALGSFNSGFISSATSSFVTLQGSDIFASSTLVVDGLSVLGGDIVPDITDGSSLGTTALNFSDLFLDLGAVINFDSGDVTITHGSNDLSVAGGTLSILGGFISSASSSATSLSATDLFASSTIVADGQALFALTGGSVGIGTTSPSKRLSVADEVSDAQVAIAYDTTRYAHLQVDSAGDLIIDAQGGDIRLNDENLFVCASGSCPSGTPSAQGSVIAETEIGIGSSTPAAQLGVANNIFIGGGGAPALGTATSTFEGDIIILGKLDVGTIDPAYTIGNTTYATYGHSTVGVKEEVAIKIKTSVLNTKTGYYEYHINFDDLIKDSDLWLFYQITDFGKNWENLVINLTPAFDGRVFYEENIEKNRLIISSTASGNVSIRLIAPRLDSDKWGNVRPDQDGWKGFMLNVKEKKLK